MSPGLLGNFFVSGLLLGVSWCTLSCGSAVLPCVCSGPPRTRDAVAMVARFQAGKLFAYMVLGAGVGLSEGFVRAFQQSRVAVWGGVLCFALLGAANLWGGPARKNFVRRCSGPGAGMVLGFLPCGPLVGFLAFLSYMVSTPWEGALSGFVFGVGNAVSPFFLLALFARNIRAFFLAQPKRTRALEALVSMVFFGWAGVLLWRALA